MPTFLRAALLVCGAWLPFAALAQPPAIPAPPAAAAPDAEERQIIEGLTRGIRVPNRPGGEGASGAAPAAPQGEAGKPPTADEPPSVNLTVFFPTGSARITPQAADALAALGRALNREELRPFRFRVEGHTDTEGDAGMNQMLSERRALAVREHLIEKFGIAPHRLLAQGMGESRLLIPTPDNFPEPRNRRVQIVNLGE
ncbi:OmpA family protein [Roseococcus thiosulfatophilus]|uniref:OmpA family protein n=1 Tax=Roseococcus thiosulfatophilus TaxID=35813 RepID=UPI001A8FF53C|nr:OmpA family protein [Roseococcus thiosulfatophilus]